MDLFHIGKECILEEKVKIISAIVCLAIYATATIWDCVWIILAVFGFVFITSTYLYSKDDIGINDYLANLIMSIVILVAFCLFRPVFVIFFVSYYTYSIFYHARKMQRLKRGYGIVAKILEDIEKAGDKNVRADKGTSEERSTDASRSS